MASSIPDVPIHCTKLFINNEFVDSVSGKTFPSIDPATGKVIAEVSEADAPDVDAAVKAAAEAFKRGSAWRSMPGSGRAALLHKLADLIERDKLYMADLEALDNGKPVKMALWVDMGTAVSLLRFHAGYIDKLTAHSYPVHGSLAYSRYEPIGVVGAIVPFNFPTLGAICKMAPALAMGCTIVVKTAERTPLGALYLARLVKEAGFPLGVVNILSGFGRTAGAALVNHPLVRKITFTGSNAVGKYIARQAAESFKRVTLECGGKNALIVLPDADIDKAVQVAHGGNFFNAGQICVGVSRCFVHESQYDAFVAKAAAKASSRTLGHQWSGADQGPLIDKDQLDRVLGYIQSGKDEGARLVCGGDRWNADSGGFYVQPTVFADVTDDMKIAREEIFGPVMSILKYSTVGEAVDRANALPYGLAAAVVGSDISRALPVAHALEAGTVWINQHGNFDASAPYGGFKESGLGREYGLEGMLAYTEQKTVMVALGVPDGCPSSAL
jgi:aldehyde dehydrogenase (NAD+)